MTTLCLSSVPAARAVSGCTNDLLNGGFGLQFSGSSTPAAGKLIGGLTAPANTPTTSPVSVTGIVRLTASGGSLSGYSWGSVQGAWVMDSSLSGTYSVNTDCTLSLSLMDASGATAQFSGIIVGQGNSILVTQTDAGAGVSGQMSRVRGFCQTSDLMGSFGIQYTGSVLGSSGGPTSSTGMVSLDGNGGANSSEDRVNNGKYADTNSTGTIAVNPDCSFSLKLSAGDGSSVNFAGLVAVDANQAPQLLLVRSDAGTAVTGSMVTQ